MSQLAQCAVTAVASFVYEGRAVRTYDRLTMPMADAEAYIARGFVELDRRQATLSHGSYDRRDMQATAAPTIPRKPGGA